MRALYQTVLFAAFLLIACGCGYTTDSLIRDDINSVYVGYFENEGWIHGLEVDLRRALEREVRLHTGMRLADREGADSLIEGELRDYSVSSITRSAEDETLMKRVDVELTYRWTDGLSGRELIPPADLSKSVLLAVGLQEKEAERVFRDVAREIVHGLERNW